MNEDGKLFLWNDDDCNKTFRFVCEAYTEKYHKPVDKWLPSGQPTTAGCQNGWTKYAGGCYRYFGDNHEDKTERVRRPFHEANAYCQQTWSGATLAIMPNIHYQWFLTSMMAQVIDTPWIGVISEAQDRKVSH